MIGLPGIGRHRRVRGLLSAYIDGEVTESAARRVEGHLGLCDECRRELDTLRSTVDLLGRLPELAVRRSFALPEAPAPVAPPLRFESFARLAAPVAAVLLVALVVGDALGVISQGGPGGPFAVTVSEDAAVEAEVVVAEEVVLEKEVLKEVVVEKEVVKEAAADGDVPVRAAKSVERVVREAQEESVAGPAGQAGPVEDAPVATARKQEVASAEVGPPDDVAPEGQWALVSLTDGSGGIALPLWQIEVAVVVLLASLLAVAFRGRRRTGR